MAISAERNAAEFLVSRLIAHIAKLRLRGHPGDLAGPSEWLNLCQSIAETSLEYLGKFDDLQSLPEQVATLKDVNDLNNTVYALLVEMEGSGIDDLPYAVVGPMQRWIEMLSIPNVTFFRALSVAKYEISRFRLSDYEGIRDPAPSLRRILAEQEKWPYLRITVPSRALGILPHFAIVAHEIGHIVHDKVSPLFAFSDAALNDFSNRVLQALNATEISAESKTFFTATTTSWLAEMFADAVGICMLGPAFYFALCEFLESNAPGYFLNRTHPPAILRRKIAYSNMTRTDRWDHPSSFAVHTGVDLSIDINSQLLEPAAPKDVLVQSLIMRNFKPEEANILFYLPDLVETLADDIFEQAYGHLAASGHKLLYTSSDLDRDLMEHLEPLVAAIPPAETGNELSAKHPTDLATILNVGWAVLLTRLDKLAVRQEGHQLLSAEKSEKLHSLLLKAVELSEARRTWSAA